ncbi:hypothetical protein HDU67_002827 [Dinochytrium kinnereticum]|nr:hypothetical protein HDU67_002827 [Dinochytrium kinnereticum]
MKGKLLTNAEVLRFINEVKDDDDRSHMSARFQNLLTVQFEVRRSLSKSQVGNLSERDMLNAARELEPFGLTKGEQLMILNLLPTSLVDLYLIVEEIDQRLPSDEQQKLLEICCRINGQEAS